MWYKRYINVLGLGRNRVRREWWGVARLSLGAYAVRAEEADQDSRLRRLQRALHAHALHYCIIALPNACRRGGSRFQVATVAARSACARAALLHYCGALCMRKRCMLLCCVTVLLNYWCAGGTLWRYLKRKHAYRFRMHRFLHLLHSDTCRYICICVCMYVCMYIYIYIYICVCVCKYV
jgi:hypothetical protein